MENRFEITKEMLMKARDYLTLNEKEAIALMIAPACVKKIWDYNYEESRYYEEKDLLPEQVPIWGEDQAAKSAAFIGAVMFFSFGEDIGDNILISSEAYDKYAGSHVFNQIERFKSTEYREKAFDIISDYREMERHLNSAIYSVLRELNDPVKRFMEAFGTMGSIEGIQEAVKSIEEAKDGIEAERERQESIINGEGGDADAGTDE